MAGKNLSGTWHSRLADIDVRVEDNGGTMVLEFWGGSPTGFAGNRREAERLIELGYWVPVVKEPVDEWPRPVDPDNPTNEEVMQAVQYLTRQVAALSNQIAALEDGIS